ncbi:MAG: FAD-dependent oxidoreductase [Pseudomonadota bacterium]|nr:FAD-dependent oxidoreductase [Pseudomonadota bacterium]
MFKHLFTPFQIGKMELRNRIVMLPMTTGYGELDETVGDRFIAFFAARAKGGAGLIVIPFSPVAAGSPAEPGIFDDRFLPGVSRLTAAIRAHGAKSSCQLIASYHVTLGSGAPEAVGPSPVLNRVLRRMPRALTVPEIESIVAAYGSAARRVREGGFDALEVLVGGGYLLNRFLSPIANLREDEYGGSLENRLRIVREVVAAIRAAVGDDFPLGIRLNLDEQMPGGHAIAESMAVARELEKAGVDFIDSYTGWHESSIPTVAPSVPKGGFAHLAGAIRGVVGIPVIAANRINDPFTAEKILAAGQADLVGMARPLLADPELPNKAQAGRTDEIVPCIACSRCLGEILAIYKNWGAGANVFCSVNPLAGREGEPPPEPAGKAKKVFVVGGGPAGLEAARVAALRGHRVTLFEREEETGGWLRVGCLPPHKEEIAALAGSLAARAQKAGVEIRLRHEAAPGALAAAEPDALIFAAGASPLIPPIPGIDAPHVVPAEDILTGRRTVRGAVIVIGGGLVGCETAEFLLDRGDVASVVVLEMLDRMAPTVSITYRPFFLARLQEKGVRMETETRVEEITADGVRVSRGGVANFIAGDWIVLAAGLRADPAAVERFRGVAPEFHAVGDCVGPRMIKEAMEEGFAAGMGI